jgi:hypothetical protein
METLATLLLHPGNSVQIVERRISTSNAKERREMGHCARCL